jgi:hypothetical protein
VFVVCLRISAANLPSVCPSVRLSNVNTCGFAPLFDSARLSVPASGVRWFSMSLSPFTTSSVLMFKAPGPICFMGPLP